MVNKDELKGVLFAFLVVTSGITGVVSFSAQPVSADIGVQGTCKDDVVVGLLTGDIVSTLYSNVVDPCYAQNNEVSDVDTEEEAQRRIAQLALEDKRHLANYWTQFDQYSDRLGAPAKLDGKIAFSDAMSNGSSEAAAITDAHIAAHNRTASQQRSLWMQYRSVLDSMEHLELQAADNGVANESFKTGYVDDSGTFHGGYTLVNYSQHGATVAVTLTNGEEIRVPAPYKTDGNGTVTDTLHPVQDSVYVGVFNPETGKVEDIINTGSASFDPAPMTVDGPVIGNQKSKTWETPQRVLHASANYTHNSQYYVPKMTVFFEDGSGVRMTMKGGGSGLISYSSGGGSWSQKASVSSLGSKNREWSVTRNNSTGHLTFEVSGANSATWTHSQDKSISKIKIHLGNGYNDGLTVQNFHVQYGDGEYVFDYENQFAAKHQRVETIDNNVIDALGDSTSGFLHDWKVHVQNSDEQWSSGFTAYERSRMTMEPKDIGEQGWRAFQHTQLGFGGANVSDTVKIKVLNGSTFDGAQLSQNVTVSGQLFTAATPPNGTWVTGETYTVGDGADLTQSVYVMRTVTTQSVKNGTITYETRGKTSTISSGEIKIVSIQNSDGANIEEADHVDRDPDSTDVSEMTARINDLQTTIEALRHQIDEDGDGNEQDGGVGAGDVQQGISDWFSSLFSGEGSGGLFNVLPFGSATVSIAALVLGGGVLLIVLSQLGIVPMLLSSVLGQIFGKK